MRRTMMVALLLSGVLAAQTAAPKKPAGAASTSAKPTAAATKPATAKSTVSEAQATEFLRHMFGYDPALQYKVMEVKPSEVPGVSEILAVVNNQPTKLYVMPDGKHAMVGEVLPYGADPFADARNTLAAGTKGAPWRGNPNGKVEVVEFSDLQCPHCKAAQPILDKLVNDQKDVKLVFQQFPIAQIHKWATQAAAYADCIGRKNNDQFWAFVTGTFNQQDQITEQNATDKLNEIARGAGADPAAVAACAATPETKARVQAQYDRGVSVGVSGTPTVFINGRKISNLSQVPPETLKQLVEFAAKEAGSNQQASK